jgi:predicted transcriptional regulator
MNNNLSLQDIRVKDILKTDGIFRFDISDTLSQVLPKLSSSHDAAFVFNQDEFVGIISPVYLVKTRSVNTKTKLKSVVKMPPKLQMDMGLSKVALAMIDSKIYYLPVVNDYFEGIVTINRLLDFVTKYNLVPHNQITFGNDPLISINDGMNISHAISLMSKENIARLPVVDENSKLIGFLSNYDLKDLVRDTNGERRNNRASQKQNYYEEPVKNYMKRNVITVTKIPTFSHAVSLMNQYNIGSLVIVDGGNKPMSIITKKDLLQTIAFMK